MNVIFAFFKKYYGTLIGGLVGGVLIASYYFLTEYLHLSSTSSDLLRIIQFLVPSIETVIQIMFFLLGVLAFLAWPLLAIFVYAALCFHIMLTVVLYGFVGFLVHYILRNPVVIKVTIDKNNKI